MKHTTWSFHGIWGQPHNRRMASADCEFVLLYADYAQSFREAGVEPLPLAATRSGKTGKTDAEQRERGGLWFPQKAADLSGRK